MIAWSQSIPRAISLVIFNKIQHKTQQPTCTILDTPEECNCKFQNSFSQRETAVEQSTNELSYRVTLMAGTSTVVAINQQMTQLCTKLLVAPESNIAVKTVSKISRATNVRQDVVSRSLGSHLDNCIPAAGYNKQDVWAVFSLDKHPTKTGQYVVLPTIGWHMHCTRARNTWGSAGHQLCNCRAGETITAA